MLRSVTEVFFSGVAVASCKVEQEAGYSFSAHRLTINLCWRVQKDHGHGHESWYVWYLYQYDMVCLYGMLIWYAYILQEVPTGAIPGCPTGGALLGADERRKA